MNRSILLFCSYNPQNKGSLADYYRFLVGKLVSRGWRVTIVFPLPGPLAEQMQQLGAVVYTMPFRTRGLLCVPRLVRIMRRHRVGIVVSYFVHSVSTLASWLAFTGTKTVWVLFSPRGAGKPKRRVRSHNRILAVVMQWVNHIVCGSEFIRQEAIETYSLPDHKISTLCLGVDTQRFYPVARPNEQRESFSIIAIQRFSPPKDAGTLIRALKILVEGLHVSAHLRFAGIGPGLSSAMALAEELGVAQFIEFLGYVNDVESYIATADVAVLSTVMESLGYGTLEPMAMGVPVIASDVGGIPEVIQDGKNGLLFPVGDAERLAQCLARVAHDENLRGRLATQGLETVRTCFDLARQAARYVDLFEQLEEHD